MAGNRALLAQIGHQIPACQDAADIGLSERLAIGLEHRATCLHATVCERNVGSDADVARTDVRGDPVIGDIGPIGDIDHLHMRLPRRTQAAIGDNEDLGRKPRRDIDGLVFDRAGISIDVDGRHGANARIDLPSCIRSKPLLMSSSGMVWVIIGSISILPSMYQSTIFGTSVRPRAPPKAVPRQLRPVTSWNGRVEISCPAGATPMMIDSPQPLCAAFQRRAHDLGVADAFEGIVRAAAGQLDQMADQIARRPPSD
jgi:hypothetical protein